MKFVSILLKTVFIFAVAIPLQAQRKFSKYEAGLSGGVLIYQGDLTPEDFGAYKTMRPQLALHLYRILTPSLSVRLNVNRGKLYANDAVYANPSWRQQRNFNFTTPVTELSLVGIWSFLNPIRPRLSPYVFAGGGFSFLNIKRDYSNLNTEVFNAASELQQGLVVDVAKKLPRIIPVIPVGAGIRYSLNSRFAAILETNYRLSFTDYLDGFSQSANPKLNDHYLSHSVGVVYSFDKKEKAMSCPKVVL
jgi:Domain of unknown function (DUF6089)